MSSLLPAQITLGGCVARRLVPRLCIAISQERLLLAGGTPFQPRSAADLLQARRPTDGTLFLRRSDESSHEPFQRLEAFLTKHQIPFDRQSSGSAEGSRLVVYRPGRSVKSLPATSQGEAAVAAQPVWALLEDLHQVRHQLQCGTWHGARRRLQAVLRDFRQHLPYEPPALPAFEIGQSCGLRTAA